jgi:hypothetical protein
MLAGVTPAIGGAPVLVPRSRDFEVTWTPAGAGPDQVILMLDLSSGAFSCSCTAPDSAGKVTLRSSLLSQPGSSPSSGTIRLARTTTSTVPVDNATIDLVGEVAVSGAVKLQ